MKGHSCHGQKKIADCCIHVCEFTRFAFATAIGRVLRLHSYEARLRVGYTDLSAEKGWR